MKKKEAFCIIITTVICCVVMALVDTVIEPLYAVKSVIKIAVFLLLPVLAMKSLHIRVFDRAFALNKNRVLHLLLLGAAIYAAIIGACLLTKNAFDYAALVASLTVDQKVNSNRFIGVALYISFCNSFLEEFLFRYFAFLKLSEFVPKRAAYWFSAAAFAVYHVAMIGASFPLPLLITAVIGLTVGGLIFDAVDAKDGSIYHSWMIHMFADFALMTIWYIHIVP